MSGHDLYLVLRERLEAVADTIHIDSEILDEAQNARGFSHERMARELFISEKTWRRWKAKGAVPADRLDDVAGVLNLDIERPPVRRVILAEDASPLAGVTDPQILRRLEELGGAVGDLLEGQATLLRMCEQLLAEREGATATRADRPKHSGR